MPVPITSRCHSVFPKDRCNLPGQEITNSLLGEDSEKHNHIFRPETSKQSIAVAFLVSLKNYLPPHYDQ
jgi:hypothetical protein